MDANTLFEAVGTLAESAAVQADFNQLLASRLVEIEGLVRRLVRQGSAAFYAGDHLAVTRVLDGFFMYADTHDVSVTPHLLIDGEWEPHVKKMLLRLIKPGMTVIDAGANFGYFTMLAAKLTGPDGRVYAFEPHPRNFEILHMNVAVNWYHDRVRAFPYALLDSAKRLEMHTTPILAGVNSLFSKQVEAVKLDQKVAVEAKTMDEIVHERVDVMKIDVEGSEPFVFEGMKDVLARSPEITIVMEFNPPALKAAGKEPKQFLDWLRDGFTVEMLSQQGVIEPMDERILLGQYIHTVVLKKA